MNTKHTESKLLTRQASKEENDLLISRIDSTYEAAKLRNTKIRLSNIKLDEIVQVMRNKSKWIKN